MHRYQVSSNGRSKEYRANSEWEARALFQEDFGTWPAEEAVTLLP